MSDIPTEPELVPLEDPDLGPLFAIRQDVGPFVKLGSQFTCNKSRWLGKAVASPTAIYLLKKAKNTSSHGGGIAGALITAALVKDDGLATCTSADLPDPVRLQLDRKRKLAAKAVVIIPRTTVSFVKSTRFNNVVKVTAGSDKFNIATNLFKMFATPRKLAALGWTLNTELTPTDAPVHDTRTEDERLHPRQKPLWQRILMVAGAILVFLAIIAIRILAHLH